MDIQSNLVLILVIAVVLFHSGIHGQNIVRHGNSYKIKSTVDGSYLTATQHTFRAKQGVYVGRVFMTQFHGGPNQYWDAITWPNSSENQFWMYAKAAALNEITAVPLSDASIPPKNLVNIIYVPSNSTFALYRNNYVRFLIQSVALQKCIQNNGMDVQISYEQCDPDNEQQFFVAQTFVGDIAKRNQVNPFRGQN